MLSFEMEDSNVDNFSKRVDFTIFESIAKSKILPKYLKLSPILTAGMAVSFINSDGINCSNMPRFVS